MTSEPPQKYDSEWDAFVASRHPHARLSVRWINDIARGRHGNQTAYPFLDPGWRRSLKHEFAARFWELYLVATMMECRAPIIAKTQRNGPDITLAFDADPIQIEAVVPGPGATANPDRVPPLPIGEASRYPTSELILRIIQALEKKRIQYEERLLRKEIVAASPYVIAINLRNAMHYRGDTTPPLVLRSLFGFGDLAVTFDRRTGNAVEKFLTYSPTSRRASGRDRPTTAFASQSSLWTGISAVIWANIDAAKHPGLAGNPLNSALAVVRNPFAPSPLPKNLAFIGTEYEAEVERGEVVGYRLIRPTTPAGA